MFIPFVFSHTVVVFTNADRLENQTIEEVIQSSGDALKKIFEKTNNCWLAFNNRDPSGDEPKQLFEIVETYACL